MTRTVLAILAGSTLALALTACESSDPEDEKMTQRREPPAEKRVAPGAGVGMSSDSDEEGGEKPPGTEDDG